MARALLALALLACAGAARAARVPARPEQHVMAENLSEPEPEPPVWPSSFEVREERGKRIGERKRASRHARAPSAPARIAFLPATPAIAGCRFRCSWHQPKKTRPRAPANTNTQNRSPPSSPHARALADAAPRTPKPTSNPPTRQARYTLTLPYVTALQTGGLHMPVRVVYDAGNGGRGGGNDGDGEKAGEGEARGERLRLELYGGTDTTVTANGVVFNAYPRVNATACDREAEPSGPTAAGKSDKSDKSDNDENAPLPSLAPFPAITRPHWHYGGRALVPRKGKGKGGGALRAAHLWTNTTRHPGSAKTSSYSVYVDAETSLPLRFYMVGFNVLASSHYDEYLLDFEAFEPRDFSSPSEEEEEGASEDGKGKGGEFEVPDACPRGGGGGGGENRGPNARTLAALRAQAAMAMPWSSVGRAAAAAAETGALPPPLLQGRPASAKEEEEEEGGAPPSRAAALAYIRAWNGRREEELRTMQRAATANSNTLVRPLLRPNHLIDLTDEEYAATMTAAGGGLAARRRRAERARAMVAAEAANGPAPASSFAETAVKDKEDALARAEANDALINNLPEGARSYHLGTLVPSYQLTNRRHDHHGHHPHRPLPREVDWRGTPADPGPPTDQGTCGSCWAFAAAGAMSGAWAVATGQVRSLSQQQMVDCAWRTGNNGCGGGWIEKAIAYVADGAVSGGAISEDGYPYTNANSWCGDAGAWALNRDRTPARGGSESSPPPAVARFRGFAAVRPYDDAALMDAVARHGPIAVSIDASPLSFKFFGGGVYWSDECGWRPSDLDHAVLLMGYGVTPEGADYWLIRNSWSALWGDNGYIRVKRGFGVDCGITTSPFAAVVDEEAAAAARASNRAGGAPLVPGWRPPVTTAVNSTVA